MKKILYCSSLLLLLLHFSAGAQISITAFPYNYAQQFTGFNGTIAGLPAGWVLTGTTNARGQGNGSSNTGGMWAYGNSPEYALGALCSGTSASINYTVSFKNNSSQPITKLTITYDFEQWRYGGGNTNGFNVTQTGIGAAVSGLSNASGTSTTSTPSVTPKSIALTGLSIAVNATFSLTWSIADGAGNDNGVAIDNFTLLAETAGGPIPAVITADPVNAAGCAGAGASFSVMATNATGYQWQEFVSSWNNLTNIGIYTGVNTASLSIAGNSGLSGRQYRCIALGAGANDTSAPATLLVNMPPVITTQPLPAALCPANDTAFRIAATGSNLTYQWQVNTGSVFTNLTNGALYSGATTNILRVMQVNTSMNAYQYRCNVSGACTPAATSNPAVLTVYPLPVASLMPAANFPFCQGDSILLTANSGLGLTYQWLINNIPQASATSNIYKHAVTGSYAVTVTDTNGCRKTSAPVAATAVAHAAMITPLGSLIFCTGGQVALAANSGAGFTHQWLKNDTLMPGVNADTLTVSDSGYYRVVVINNIGCTDTSMAVTVVSNSSPAAVITAQGLLTFCSGDSVTLDAGFLPGLTYEWLLNGVPLAGVSNARYTVYYPGNYSVKVGTSNACYTYAPTVTVTVKPLPAAQIVNTAAPVFCQGDSLILSANTGAGYSYLWYRNTTPLTGAANDSLTVMTSGQYTVRITDGNGCSKTAAPVDVTVNQLPAATITPSGNAIKCVGDSLVLTANAGAQLAYQWYHSSSIIGGASVTQYIARATGSYSVLVTDSNGCMKRSAAVSLTLNPLPAVAATLSGPAAFCQGGNIGITVPLVANHTYQWFRNSTGVPGGAATYTASTSGIYQVVVTNTATTCKNTSLLFPVTVYPLPAAVLTVATPTIFCEGDSVMLKANTGARLSYRWLYDGQNIAGISGSQYAAKATGNYAVLITDSNSCTKVSDTQSVRVNPMPGGMVTYLSPLSFCEGGAVVLMARVDTGITFQWLKNGQPQGITTYSNIVDASGSYAITQTNSFNCTKISPTVPVTVWPLPAVPVISRSGLELSTGIYSRYQWYRNGQTLLSGISRSITVGASGAYTVEVTDTNGCRGTSAVLFVNNVGIGRPGAAASIRIYPNPVQEVLTVEAPFKVRALLLDMQGRTLLEQDNVQSLRLGNLPAGIYLLQIKDGEGTIIKKEKVNKIN